MDAQSNQNTAQRTLRILRTPPPGAPSSALDAMQEVIAEGGRKLTVDTGSFTVPSFPPGFKLPQSARLLREAGNLAVGEVENTVAIAEVSVDLTNADVKLISALTHALDVAIGTIAGRIIDQAATEAAAQDLVEPDEFLRAHEGRLAPEMDAEDVAVEAACMNALTAAFGVFHNELGGRVGNPLHWHPDATALAAVMMDTARGWIEPPAAAVPGRIRTPGIDPHKYSRMAGFQPEVRA